MRTMRTRNSGLLPRWVASLVRFWIGLVVAVALLYWPVACTIAIFS